MMQLVTASDTAVFRSEISSSVGFSCVQNEATATLASASFTGLLSKMIVISFVFSIINTLLFTCRFFNSTDFNIFSHSG